MRTERFKRRGMTRRDPERHVPLLLLAEDDDDLRCALADLFVADGFQVKSVPDGALLVDMLERMSGSDLPDVIVTDHRMPGFSGLDILTRLQAAGKNIPVVLITGHGREVTQLAEALGATAVFDKPFNIDEVRAAVLSGIDWTHRELVTFTPKGEREWFPGIGQS